MNAQRVGRYPRPLQEKPYYATLVLLGREGALPLKAIAARAHYSEGQIAIHLRSLRKRGLVARSNPPKRATYGITDAGRLALAA